MRALLSVVFVAFGYQAALAFDSRGPLDWRNLLAKELPHTFYAGAGGGFVHHTGYVPTTRLATERWVAGGKAFAGILWTDQIRFETGYYYLGRSQFFDGSPVFATEQSHAVTAASLIYTPELTRWGVPTALPTRMFARIGGAYKWINHQSGFGTFDEGGLSYLVGGGLEVDLSQRVFFRFEYEYISKIVSGTTRAVDVQHTPLTLTLGGRF
jgi:opacity protein-like surface antigen